jgi:hypothetical protein
MGLAAGFSSHQSAHHVQVFHLIKEGKMSNDQFADMHRKNIDAAMKLTQMSLENSKRIMELQVETARALFEDSVKSARALTEAKDPQAALALRTQFAQETSARR